MTSTAPQYRPQFVNGTINLVLTDITKYSKNRRPSTDPWWLSPGRVWLQLFSCAVKPSRVSMCRCRAIWTSFVLPDKLDQCQAGETKLHKRNRSLFFFKIFFLQKVGPQWRPFFHITVNTNIIMGKKMHKDNPVRCSTSLRHRRRTGALSAPQTWFSQQSLLRDGREPKPSSSRRQSAFLKLWLVTPRLVTDLFLVGTHDKTTSFFTCERVSPGETPPSRSHSAGGWRFRWRGKSKNLLSFIAEKNSVPRRAWIPSGDVKGGHCLQSLDYCWFFRIWPT